MGKKAFEKEKKNRNMKGGVQRICWEVKAGGLVKIKKPTD